MGKDQRLLDVQSRIGSDAMIDEPMWRHTSFRVGGPADLFVRARSSSDLERIIPVLGESGLPWRVLGGATNVLVADAGIRQCVVSVDGQKAELARLLDEGDTESEDVLVRVPAGCKLILAARMAVDQGLGGLEWAVGIPGTVGGAVVNIAAIFVGATAIESSGRVVRLTPDEMNYSYRRSAFKAGERRDTAIISADFKLRRSSRAELIEVASKFEEARKQRQPPGLSAGSVFKNPAGDYSGRLIEAAGLKGTRVGGAEVSAIHGNFFINAGGAKAEDLYRLMRTVQDSVWARFSVWLEPEVELLGEWTDEERSSVRAPSPAARPEPAVSTTNPGAYAADATDPDFEPDRNGETDGR